MFDSLWTQGLQPTRLLCPSLTPRVCSNSCPLSQWCCLIISSSVSLFSFCLQSFPASGSFPVSQLFTSDGQSMLQYFSSISSSNEYSGLISFRIDWFNLLSPRDSHAISLGLQFESINSSTPGLLYDPSLTSIHNYWQTHSFAYMDFCQ